MLILLNLAECCVLFFFLVATMFLVVTCVCPCSSCRWERWVRVSSWFDCCTTTCAPAKDSLLYPVLLLFFPFFPAKNAKFHLTHHIVALCHLTCWGICSLRQPRHPHLPYPLQHWDKQHQRKFWWALLHTWLTILHTLVLSVHHNRLYRNAALPISCLHL